MQAPRITRPLAAALAVAGALAVTAGCASDGGGGAVTSATSGDATTAAARTPLPAPTGPVVLEVGGSVALPNAGRRVRMDMAALEGLGTREITLYEPFRKRDMTFRAVPLARVLDAAGVPSGGTLHTVALNDYSVDIPMSVARGQGTYVATRDAAGEAIPVAAGGPIRIVFLDGATGADVENYWNWSLATAVARAR
jgi:hypothetical protein